LPPGAAAGENEDGGWQAQALARVSVLAATAISRLEPGAPFAVFGD